MKELLKGTITAGDGLAEVLEIVNSLKEVESCVLQVSGGGGGGLVGLKAGWHITGAMTHTGEAGRAALRKILQMRSGTFQVLNTGPNPLDPLRQGLKIAIDNVLPYIPNDIHPKVTPWLFDYNEIIEVEAAQTPVPPQMVPPAQPQFAPPAQPQIAPPAQPQIAPPAQPQIAPPAQPQIAPPAQPQMVPPAQPQIAPPAQPQIAPPAQPQIAPPAQPQIAPPAQPQIAPPAQPQIAPPAQPQIAPPAQPQMAPPAQPQMAPPAQPQMPPAQPNMPPAQFQVQPGQFQIPPAPPQAEPPAQPQIPSGQFQLPPAEPQMSPPMQREIAPPLQPSFETADNAVDAEQMPDPAALVTWAMQQQAPAAPKARLDVSRSRMRAADILPEVRPAAPSKTVTTLKIAGICVLLACAVVAPFTMHPTFLMKALCLALFACAFNLLLGFAGLLSFGHAAFYGTGAYMSGYAAKTWGLSAELCLLSGTVLAMVLGLIVGTLAIRRQGMYFAMITLAMSQLVYYICFQSPYTGGSADGMQGIPRTKLFGLLSLTDDRAMYFFVLATFIVGFALIFRIIHSPFGQVLKAIRENEPRAISLGYDTDRYKLIAFVLSSSVAGLAGAAKALSVQLVSISDVHFHLSGEVVLMTLLGGIGTLLGPVVGAFLISAVDLGDWIQLAVGVIFIICLLFFRNGIVGSIRQLLRWHQRVRIRARLRPDRARPPERALPP